MKSFRAVFRAELKMFLREPFAFFFTVIFPLGLTLLIGFTFGDERFPEGYRGSDLALPINFSFLIANLGLMAVPQFVTEQRQSGVLKRFLVLPLSRGALLMGSIAVNIVMFFISASLIYVTGVLLFNAGFFGNLLEIFITVVLGLAAFFLLGYAIAIIPTTPRTTSLVASAVFFTMLFFSGVMIPVEEFPGTLQQIVRYLPLTNLLQLFKASWLSLDSIFSMWPSLLNLLAVIALSLLIIGMRRGSYEHGQK